MQQVLHQKVCKIFNLFYSKLLIVRFFGEGSEVAPVAETDLNKKITILINIEQPDIILVEAMDDINCLALILNVCIKLLLHFAIHSINLLN